MHNLSDWRSVRLWETELEGRLRRRYSLRLHGWAIGAFVLLTMWAASHLQMVLGSGSLALRYLVTLGVGYLTYLLVLRVWARALARDERIGGDVNDLPGLDGGPGGSGAGGPSVDIPSVRTGGGGDFGGGGATGDFSAASEGNSVGDMAGDALGAAASADEGVVVVVPVVMLFIAGTAILLGAGSLLLLYFGSETLLAVVVELAFTYVSAKAAVRVAREGWLGAAVRLTWKPLGGALVCAVALGAAIDVFVPQAKSLPHAIELVRDAPR